jgi:thiamine transport system substrate-binding protein
MNNRTMLGAAMAASLALTACSTLGESDSEAASGSAGTATGGRVVLVTHESFAVGEKLLADFEQEAGLSVDVRQLGDAGALVNQLVLTKDSPLGDAVFGIDNTFASRALNEGVLAPYDASALPEAAEDLRIAGSEHLTPVDYGDVCVNADLQWFADHDLAVPETLADLTDPAYADLLVVSDPTTSSPGLAFLLATVAAYGESGWLDYWAALRDNGVKVAGSWSDAYYVDFSGSDGNGTRPLVLSYASSPPSEVQDDRATTSALLDTCFRQVEYAGVIAGAANPDGAKQVVDFLLSAQFQKQLPTRMYVYPVDPRVELPVEWKRFAPSPARPWRLDAEQIDVNRSTWVQRWADTVLG